jgi:hypothetical protein
MPFKNSEVRREQIRNGVAKYYLEHKKEIILYKKKHQFYKRECRRMMNILLEK